jgi:GTPase SAR1 family protein
MLRDMLSYVGLQSLVSEGDGPSPPILSSGAPTSSGCQDPENGGVLSSFSSCGRSMSCAPPHVQKLLQAHQARGGPSIRIVIRGARRTGKSSLLTRMQGGGGELWSSMYHPTQAIQPGVFLWRPRAVAPSNSSCLGDRGDGGAASSSSALCETRVELWDVVDRGTPNPVFHGAHHEAAGGGGQSLQHLTSSTTSSSASVMMPTDASTIDVYRGAHGVVFLYDATSRDTFDHVLEALPRVPKHLPVAICGNFWDLVHADKERLEVDEKDVEKLLRVTAHRAVTPLFASFIAAVVSQPQSSSSRSSNNNNNNNNKTPPAALSSFVVDPVHIQLSVKDGFGLTPLHRFTGVCAAFAKAMELDAAIRIGYGRVASAAEDLNKLNDEQKYDEFLQWRADAEARRLLEESQKQHQQQQQQHHQPSADWEEAQDAPDPLKNSNNDRVTVGRNRKYQDSSIRSGGRAKRPTSAVAAAGGASSDTHQTTAPSAMSRLSKTQQQAAMVVATSVTFGDAIASSFFDGCDDEIHDRAGTKSERRRVASSDDDDSDVVVEAVLLPVGAAVQARISDSSEKRKKTSTSERKARILEQLAAQSIIDRGVDLIPITATHLSSSSRSQHPPIDATVVSALTQSFEDHFAAARVDADSGDDGDEVADEEVHQQKRSQYERSGGGGDAHDGGRGVGYGSHSTK